MLPSKRCPQPLRPGEFFLVGVEGQKLSRAQMQGCGQMEEIETAISIGKGLPNQPFTVPCMMRKQGQKFLAPHTMARSDFLPPLQKR